MTRVWPNGLPFDGICADCRAPLSRGTTRHECGRATFPLISRPTPPKDALIDRFRNAQEAK